MSAELIDISYILEREKKISQPTLISLDSFSGVQLLAQAANDNQDVARQDDIDIGFLVDIVIEKAVFQIRKSVKKKLDDRYFSILFQDEKEYFTRTLLSTICHNSFGLLSEERILEVLETELGKLGISEKIKSTILEY